jgi:uncharacterized protein YjbI with pentapeptide repeats
MNEQPSNRWQEIINIWKQRPYILNGIAGFIIGVLFFPLLNLMEKDTQGLLESLVPEGIGIVVTVLFIDTLYRRREEERLIVDLKKRLLREVAGSSNEAAKHAIDELRSEGWLFGENGLLVESTLFNANLAGARMENANLKGAIMIGANLSAAHLYAANMSKTKLEHANLSGVKLSDATFSEASLSLTDLSDSWFTQVDFANTYMFHANLSNSYLLHTNFWGANLQYANLNNTKVGGANFSGADLTNADLVNSQGIQSSVSQEGKTELSEFGAIFDENTILPDGTNWTEGRDMREFTHPDEWKAEQEAKANNT